jgi:hypothetical protein
MNIDEQLENFLAGLGVAMERPQDEYDDEQALPEVSIFQSSRDHYGVFYRLDMIEQRPHLRVIVPVEYGALKMEVYLVRMSGQTLLNDWFKGMATYSGSPAYEKGREAALQHLLYAVAEMMKQLFWSGDMENMCFPAEIDVRRLI